jgi:hypothetical protein
VPRLEHGRTGELDAMTGQKLAGMLALIAVAGFLQACEQEERGRILQYQKGTYLGPADQSLSNEQLREIEVRTNLQAWY